MTDKTLWYLCGRYLGDGWLVNRKNRNNNLSKVVICCGKHEEGEIEKEIGARFNYTKTEERTVFKYFISNKELATFINQFGRGSKNKKIPGFVFDLPKEYITELLRGYIDSDGYINKNNLYKVGSVSKELIYGIGQLIAKAYNRPYSIYHTKRKPTCVIEGRTVSQNDSYQITFKKEMNIQDKAFYEDGYIWVPINNIKQTDLFENVYDIETDTSHSFTANGVIAHNCTDISLSGKQKGFIDENGNKTRSGMYYEGIRILRTKKPALSIIENVKSLTGKKFKKEFEIVLSDLENAGYNSYYKVLNSKDYGIPQHRERVFIISIRKDLDNGEFKFPDPFDNGVRLVDMLEPYVDEKFYMKDDKVQPLLENLKINKYAPFNAEKDGTCRTIKSQYYKNSQANFIKQGDQGATCVIVNTSNNDKELIGIDKSYKNTKSIEVANCITSREDRGISNRQAEGTAVLDVTNNLKVRKLTPKECFRLQGFSDEDYEKAKSVNSNTQLYKQCGNSITVDVLYYIYVELYKAMPYLFDNLKLSSFFSGIGAFEIGLDRLYKGINSGNFTKPQVE